MRERINRLAKGIIDSDIPVAVSVPQAIDISIKASEIFKSEITVNSTNMIHLKGLVYSTNIRVTTLTASFGGLSNHVAYEVDGRYLDPGSTIEGELVVVTNGGELKVPYKFVIISGSAGRTLSNLKTVDDFALIAKADRMTALRIFEYKDFTQAPFMQDMRVRALYDGFRQHSSNQATTLEEFLIAVKAKLPVDLSIEKNSFVFGDITDPVASTVPMSMFQPGFVSMNVKAEGSFIVLGQKTVSDSDFSGGRFDFPFGINPTKLHSGKNCGSIQFISQLQSFVVNIEACPVQKNNNSGRERKQYWNKHLLSYIKLRIKYECAEKEAKSFIVNEMINDISDLMLMDQIPNEIVLLKAEAEYLAGHRERAIQILDSVGESINSNRVNNTYAYFFFEYLNCLIYGQEGRRESLLQLLYQYMTNNHMHLLFPIIAKLDKSLSNNPSAMIDCIDREYNAGNRSPFLYIEYCKMLNKHIQLLRGFGAVQMQALVFGVKHDLIYKELAIAIAKRSKPLRVYPKLSLLLLQMLYKKYPDKDIVSSICSILIKNDRRDKDAHKWFERGLEEKSGLTGLYEYYLYTLPDDYSQLLPREILLYFAYENNLELNTRVTLYENILTYLPDTDNLYNEYYGQIESFTITQLLASKIDNHLALLYSHVLKEDMIDEKLARVLPTLLNSYQIECNAQFMKSAIVLYPQMKAEDVYSLNDKKAFIPLFTDDAIVLFQDAYGNRYYNVGFEKEKVMDMPALLKKCYEVYPEHIMLRLGEINRIIEKKAWDSIDAEKVESALTQMPFSELFKNGLLSRLVSYYHTALPKDAEMDAHPEYLIRADKMNLSNFERNKVCDTLISLGYIKEACEMIRSFDCEDISEDNMEKLCTRMILDKLFSEDALLVYLAGKVLDCGRKENVILDYLCEYYNGSTDSMFAILKDAVEERTETYDMEERVLAQMLFSHDYSRLDQVFEWYVNRKKTSDSIVKAYFTVKSEDYFLYNKGPGTRLIDFLENIFTGTVEKDKVPTIYQLAIIKYYSTLPEMNEIKKQLTVELVSNLIEAGLVFPFYKQLARFITIPGDILDKAMIIYYGRRDSRVELKMRVLPGEEEFHGDEMRRMYQGIFMKEKVLFTGETLEYKIYEETENGLELKKEGALKNDNDIPVNRGSRFGQLNELSVAMERQDEKAMRAGMEHFSTQEQVAESIFGLM